MDLSFIPRRRIVEALEQGFRLVPGHEYDPLDWAILMQSEPAREVTAEDIRQLNALLKAIGADPEKLRSNKSRAGSSRNTMRYSKILRRQVSA